MHADISRIWLIVVAVLGASGVALGAVAAHAVADPSASAALDRATTYQILHAVALLALLGMSTRLMTSARLVMLFGIVMFSGAIYAKHLLGLVWLGQFAPVGGTALIVSWLLVGVSACGASKNSQS